MEIVTWVLEGALTHRHSARSSGAIYPVLPQRISAGSEILDAVRFTDADGGLVTASEPAELLVWEMHAEAGSARPR